MANKIVGTGSCLPERCVSNQELSEILAKSGIETSDDWIVTRTGIEQRYLASSAETTSYLAAQAALKALDYANVSPEEVDLIIVATTTPDYVFPSTACLVQNILGAKNAFAFDVQAVCSGFVYGLSVADALMTVGKARCAVVIGAENFSKLLDWTDRATCVLFGDGAGAVVVKSDQPEGILASKLYSDGSLSSILSVPSNFCNGQVLGDPFVKMDGQAVYKAAINALESSAKEVVSMAGLTLADVDWMIPHQANIRIIQSTAKRLGIAEQKVVVTVNIHANTSAASVPLALDAAVRDGRIQSQQTVLLQGVGGGFTWGALLAHL